MVDCHILTILSSQIRNANKKISATAKAQSVVDDNPGVSLDDLVSQKKLNADQKAQMQKKPQLQSQVTQLEEQLTQFRSFAQELEERFSREKATLVEAHEAEVAQLKEEADTKAQEHGVRSTTLQGGLKVISEFLHAAASKRSLLDEATDERRAFEGALLLVYQGNEASLSTLQNLIDGSDDKVLDTEGNPVDFTFAQLKEASLAEAQDSAQAAADPVEAAAPDSDPTIANAGMTELEDTTTIPIRTDGTTGEVQEGTSAPEQVGTTGEAANAVAEANWNPEASMTTDASGAGDEWVQIPRDLNETDTGNIATPAAATTGENSWAEEVSTSVEEQKKENDGFEPVRGRHGDGRARGRGGRGGAGRGDFRGRGRGGPGRGGEGRGRGGPGRGRGGPREPRGDRGQS